MKKQIIVLLSLFLIMGLFFSPVQGLDLDELEICPNPNSPDVPQVQSPKSLSDINSTMLKKANKIQNVVSDEAKDNEVLKVGYTCKTPTVETRTESDKGYKNEKNGNVFVRWTLVKKEGNRKIWVAHTLRWGSIFVGSVEDGVYTFDEAKEVCDRTEELAVFNGKDHYQIKMTLPEIGFGIGGSDIDRPLNFELLKYLNFTSVISNEGRNWFLSNSHGDDYDIWIFHPVSGNFHFDFYDTGHSVLCVGR